ncbi:hypothetical protein [Paenibacillus wynnii]|uniref:hypothetical protein n=1 Tax=Paenibacillus wynnii TaxID=268407 RepID=UPI0027D832A6|nr:hypothetical protein [Paenibacillus wynnii]
MSGNSDRAVMVLIGVALSIWVLYRVYIWLQSSPRSFMKDTIPINKEIIPHPALDMLEAAGYEVVGGKLRIPLSFTADGSILYSRLYIDYVASANDGTLYLVMLERPRKQLEWTGSGIRDFLLPYLLLYPECGGVLFVNLSSTKVSVIKLGKDDGESD